MKLFLYDNGNVLADRLMGTADIDLSEIEYSETCREHVIEFTFCYMHDIFAEAGRGSITIRPIRATITPKIYENNAVLYYEYIYGIYGLLCQKELDSAEVDEALARTHLEKYRNIIPAHEKKKQDQKFLETKKE